MTAQYGGITKQVVLDRAYATLVQSLTGTFGPTTTAPIISALLQLANASTATVVLMFDVLARSYGASDATFDLLSAYETGE